MAHPPTPARIARSYYIIVGIYTLSASLIWGVNTLFLLQSGLTLLQVFLANAVFTASMSLFEVPTGVVADTRGRRLSFLLSVAVLFVGTVGYVAVPLFHGGMLWFCIASVVLGLGYTFYSGAVEAWVVDALNATGTDASTDSSTDFSIDHVMARGGIISSVAMLIGTVAGGLLGGLHLVLPYIVRCALLVVAFGIALATMHETGFVPKPLSTRQVPAEMARIARESFRFGWSMPRVRLLILAGAIPAVVSAWGFHAWQPYFLKLLGTEAVWVTGTIAALISLSTIAGHRVVEIATRYCGRRTTLMFAAAAVYCVAMVGVGLVHSFTAAVALYLVGMVSTGVSGPVRQAYMHLVVPKEQRATVLSFASLVSSGGSMAGQAGLGWLVSGGSIASGYVVGGAITALAMPVVLLLRRLGGGPDRIVGLAGRYSPCANLGLPEGATADIGREAD